MKLVNCLRGCVWDVAVDIRVNSETYLQWHAVELSAENYISLLIPKGFAHGFQTLAADIELLYFHSHAYHEHSEAGLNVNDLTLAITWPLGITEISVRDKQHPMLTNEFAGVLV
jgi:dTDP-4-dehydrorhamnose 3,5-epimerase